MAVNIKVMLVDDHPLVRPGLARILNQAPGIQVVAEAESLDGLPTVLLSCSPQVILLAMEQGEAQREATLNKLKGLAPNLKVIVVSPTPSASHRQRLRQAGARGLLEKSSPVQEMVRAINMVFRGEGYPADPLV